MGTKTVLVCGLLCLNVPAVFAAVTIKCKTCPTAKRLSDADILPGNLEAKLDRKEYWSRCFDEDEKLTFKCHSHGASNMINPNGVCHLCKSGGECVTYPVRYDFSACGFVGSMFPICRNCESIMLKAYAARRAGRGEYTLNDLD